MARPVSVQQALQYVARNPSPRSDDMLQTPAHELVSRALFTVANSVDLSVRGSAARSNKARSLLMNRLEGKRGAGTAPVRESSNAVEFHDLTGEISG